jgi:hypothetical protein
VGSIKRALISNLEGYNAAGEFSSIVDMESDGAEVTLTSVDNKTL